jgi:hypothetical protein
VFLVKYVGVFLVKYGGVFFGKIWRCFLVKYVFFFGKICVKIFKIFLRTCLKNVLLRLRFTYDFEDFNTI